VTLDAPCSSLLQLPFWLAVNCFSRRFPINLGITGAFSLVKLEFPLTLLLMLNQNAKTTTSPALSALSSGAEHIPVVFDFFPYSPMPHASFTTTHRATHKAYAQTRACRTAQRILGVGSTQNLKDSPDSTPQIEQHASTSGWIFL
jgi:hypothetical protein